MKYLRERFYSFLVGNRWWGLYVGPKPLRALSSWALPRWADAYHTAKPWEARDV